MLSWRAYLSNFESEGEMCFSYKNKMACLFAVVTLSSFWASAESLAEPVDPGPRSRYMAQGETVYDKKTDLTWDRCSVGQRWVAQTGCVGIIRRYTFEETKKLGNGARRLPTKDELETLIDTVRMAQELHPVINEKIFPDMDPDNSRYWSTTYFDANLVWSVRFYNGDVEPSDIKYEGNAFAVRLLRSGQFVAQ